MSSEVASSKKSINTSGVPWGAPILLTLCIIPYGWTGLLAPLTWVSLIALEFNRGWKRAALFLICAALMLIAGLNVIPGSASIQVLQPYSDNTGNLIYASFNSGKAIISVTIIAFMMRLQQSIQIYDLPYLFVAIVIPLIIALILYEPYFKISTTIITAILLNLLVVCISEEGFFRWILQRGIEESMDGWRWLSVPIVAVIFALLHIGWSSNLVAILLLGVASFCYALLWYLRRNFWLCVLAHWGVNIFHILVLPYPLPG
ncbi:lysostaphin resistance A-like protein [Microbulbifer echini]|uniref:Lysostaphin resistance A-like protein n=1 Tax=Microbulbifer echini TaxID=1529067 RepID=A0ABV4NIK7_9GAMM